MEHTGFPSDETLAAFIDGRLEGAERRAVIEHMAGCDECYSVFMASTEKRPAPAARPRPGARAWVAVGGAAAAAAIAIVLLVTPVRERLFTDTDSAIAALAEASPNERRIDGRIARFPYQPPARRVRGGNVDPLQDTANGRLFTETARLERAVASRPTGENLHALGVASLLLGQYDAAIDRMHRALLDATGRRDVSDAIDESSDAELLTDLSAALSARSAARRGEARLRDAGEAVRCARRAWQVGKHPAAAWNLAVAVEALDGRGTPEARAAWTAYLRADPSGPWAAEARANLTR